VRDYGIDGFRVDTAKHVEMDAWQQLKTQATAALAEWKKPIRIKRWMRRRSG
jgi:alpha-amylase